MSVLDFIASLISSIAWPLAALGITFLFRHQIRRLLAVAGPLRRLKGPGGLEAFYDTMAVETKQSATEALESVGVSEQPSLTLLEGLDAVARRWRREVGDTRKLRLFAWDRVCGSHR